MLIIYIAAMLGVFRYRTRRYWTWIGVMLVWSLASGLFSAGGSLDDPGEDGLITQLVRQATGDGPAMGLYALGFLIVLWGGFIFFVVQLYRAAKVARLAPPPHPVSGGRKAVEATGLTLAFAIYVGLLFLGTWASNMEAASAPASAPTADAAGADPIALELAEAAADLTRQGPKKIDEITTLTHVTAEGRAITFHYDLAQRQGTDEQLEAFLHRNVVAPLCADRENAPRTFANGVTRRYSYTLPDRKEPLSVDVSGPVCEALAATKR